VSETGEGGDQPRAPARLTAAGADLFLQLGGELAAGCHARRRVPLLAFDDYLSGRLMADVVLAARSTCPIALAELEPPSDVEQLR